VAIDDKAATCTETGYTGRTYCAVCDSVVDWGKILPITGHSYNVLDEYLVCSCGDIIKTSGLIRFNEKIYYVINGKLSTGWIYNDLNYYYFDEITYNAAVGTVEIAGYNYVFDVNGVLIEGAWDIESHDKDFGWDTAVRSQILQGGYSGPAQDDPGDQRGSAAGYFCRLYQKGLWRGIDPV
jgi:hypothetical protein